VSLGSLSGPDSRASPVHAGTGGSIAGYSQPASPAVSLLGSLRSILHQRRNSVERRGDTTPHETGGEPGPGPSGGTQPAGEVDYSIYSRAELESMLRQKTAKCAEYEQTAGGQGKAAWISKVSELKEQLQRVMNAAFAEVRSHPKRAEAACSRARAHTQKQRLEERMSVLEFEKTEAEANAEEKLRMVTRAHQQELMERDKRHSEHVELLQRNFDRALSNFDTAMKGQSKGDDRVRAWPVAT
jgi:hypothetical protein